MPKAFMNKAGKLVKIVNGKAIPSDEPTLFYTDNQEEFKKASVKSKGKPDLKLVEVDVIIDKSKPRYVVSKKK